MKKVRLGSVLAALVMFAFPWLDIQCSGKSLATQTGFQVIIGDGSPDPQLEALASDEDKKELSRDESIGDANDLTTKQLIGDLWDHFWDRGSLLVALALIAIIGAFGFSFIAVFRDSERTERLTSVLSASALLLLLVQLLIGFPVKRNLEEHLSKNSSDSQTDDGGFGSEMGEVLGAMVNIQVNKTPAFYLELLALGIPTLLLLRNGSKDAKPVTGLMKALHTECENTPSADAENIESRAKEIVVPVPATREKAPLITSPKRKGTSRLVAGLLAGASGGVVCGLIVLIGMAKINETTNDKHSAASEYISQDNDSPSANVSADSMNESEPLKSPPPLREKESEALMSVEPEKEVVVNSSATLATERPSTDGKIDSTKRQIMREIPELFRGGWHPDPRDRTWGQISDQEGDGLKGIKLEANSISVYEGGLGFSKVELLEQGKAIRVGGRWFFEGSAGDYEELFFRISPDGKVLKNKDGTSYYRTAKVERRLKDQLHTKKSNKPSRVYFGNYGRDNAFFSIQWMGDDTLRGGVFLHESGRLLSLYATNYIQGTLNGELWEAGKLLGTVVVRKDPASGRVAWRGFNHDSGMEFNFGRNSNRRSSKEFHSSYVGRVGNSNVDIGLQWKGDGTVSGLYHSRATGRRYRLEGDNTVDGFLYLDEFTEDNLSARILLNKKRLSNGSIAWEGTMFNTDGRNKKMSFVKRQ